MPHIHTEPGQHDATASAFIVRFDTPEPQLLLHMHRKLNMLLQIGGHVELDENPWQAALHEVIDETGYSLEQLQVLQPSDRIKTLSGTILHPVAVCQQTHSFGTNLEFDHYHSDTDYALAVDGPPKNRPAEGESTDLRWVTESELTSLPDDLIIDNVREIGLHVFKVCATAWERVTLDEFQS